MMSRSINDVYDLMHNASEHENAGRFQEAGIKFYEAAELAKEYDVGYLNLISNYENAAGCFLKIKDIRSCKCYNKAIDVFVKNAISENFYRKGDNLRHKHNLKHTCVITKFDEPKIKENNRKQLQEAVSDAVLLRQKVYAFLI
ncbi:hypothetical protein RF11_00956 [Thelohanellus kitauei]|uniref:Alpha-soluble NSF attachment protein n=1 Tax=Thelohanellus kitauei TaxID=669202 RepID=A0A0C2NDQ0_THEKT|nr:hypothetical protein RF11_00956 [Thelohanellus kitauei]